MRISFRILVAAAFLACPAFATAGPITLGTWSAVEPDNDSAEFWDNPSVDDAACAPFLCNAGALIERLYGPIEYLNDGAGNPVAFSFAETIPSFASVATLTTWSGGIFAQNAIDGSFTYDANQASFPGHVSNSIADPGQFVLFRRAVPGAVQYFIAIEDIRFDLQLPPNLVSDQDYNDFIVSFRQATQQVPEPSLLLLMGTGIAGLATRRLRRAR